MRRRVRRAPRRHAVARDAPARPRRRSRTSSIAAPRARTRAPATAPASSSRCPTRSSAQASRAELPPPGRYGVAVCFLPHEPARRAALEQLLEATVAEEGQSVVGWRDVPVDARHVGATAGEVAPLIRQLFVAAAPELDDDAFERKLYVIRRRAELAAGPELVVPSFSARRVVYKGMLTAPQLPGYFPDLLDERFASALALVHSRFSTNTFPSWELAHPYRLIAHNGEINTVQGNVNWMRARESQLASELFGDDLRKVLPVVRPGGSDTATFDNVLELLLLAGRSLPHAVMMMIPEAYGAATTCRAELKGFYAYHQCLLEAWDGPAAIAFTDGRADRRDARPQRPAPGPLVRDERRLGRHGLRDRRARRAAREDRPQGPAPAGQALPRRPRPREDRRGRGDQARGLRAGSRTAAGTPSSRCGSPTCPSRSRRPRRARRCATASSRSATRRRT